eukprot:4034733-Pleurochrysis_carterae.AAC.1
MKRLEATTSSSVAVAHARAWSVGEQVHHVNKADETKNFAFKCAKWSSCLSIALPYRVSSGCVCVEVGALFHVRALVLVSDGPWIRMCMRSLQYLFGFLACEYVRDCRRARACRVWVRAGRLRVGRDAHFLSGEQSERAAACTRTRHAHAHASRVTHTRTPGAFSPDQPQSAARFTPSTWTAPRLEPRFGRARATGAIARIRTSTLSTASRSTRLSEPSPRQARPLWQD